LLGRIDQPVDRDPNALTALPESSSAGFSLRGDVRESARGMKPALYESS
jgi:hypothetical protein